MKYNVEVVEKMKAVVTVNARSVTEALSKVERKYYADGIDCCDLKGVYFEVVLNKDEDKFYDFCLELKSKLGNSFETNRIIDELYLRAIKENKK